VLEAKDGLTPLTKKVSVVEVLRLDALDKLGEVGAELLRDVGEGDDRGGLLVDELAKTGLVLHNAERHLLLAAEGREPEDKLDGIDIAGDHNKLGLVAGDKVGHGVETKAQGERALGGDLLQDLLTGSATGLQVDLLTLLDGLQHLSKTLAVLDAAGATSGILLRAHLSHDLEELHCSGLLKSVTEDVDCRGALEAVQKDALLTGKADVAGPCDKVGEIALVGHSNTESPVLGTSLEESCKTLLDAFGLIALGNSLLLLLDALRLHDCHLCLSGLLCGHDALFI